MDTKKDTDANKLMADLNSAMESYDIPLHFTPLEVKEKDVNAAMTCDICSIIHSRTEYTLMSNSSSEWLALVIAVFVDIVSGATQEQRNAALEAAGLWNGTFASGRQAKINDDYKLKVFTGNGVLINMQVLQVSANRPPRLKKRG